MCVDDDSFPPIAPISGGSAGSRDFHLTSSDGTRVMAHGPRRNAATAIQMKSAIAGIAKAIEAAVSAIGSFMVP